MFVRLRVSYLMGQRFKLDLSTSPNARTNGRKHRLTSWNRTPVSVRGRAEMIWTNVVKEHDGHYFDERVAIHFAAHRSPS